MQRLIVRSAFFVEVKKMIKKVGIVGMGALGLLYGNWIRENNDDVVVDYIMDNERLKRNQKKSFSINGKVISCNMVDGNLATPYDLIIVAVKAPALQSALKVMENAVDNDTTIISVLNGITSEKIIGERYDQEQVLYAIAQGMDAVKLQNDLTYSTRGHLLIGIKDKSQKDRLKKLASFFDQCKIDYFIKEDILHHLWAKFMLNVGINQTCMVYNTNYGGALLPGKAHETLIKAMQEVIDLSSYEGIDLNEKDLKFYLDLLATLDPNGLPSMAQDAKNKRYSEVELFSGTVIKLASKHRLDVPINRFLYQRIKEIESEY